MGLLGRFARKRGKGLLKGAPKKSLTNVTPMGFGGTYMPEVTGATIGGTIAPDLDEDGEISGAERAGGIVAGVAASRGAKRLNDRVVGSGNLPQGVKRKGEKYTVLPSTPGGLQANVKIGVARNKESLPTFRENKEYWNEQERRAGDNPARLTQIQEHKRTDALYVPQEKAQVARNNAAEAVNEKQLIRRDSDIVDMSFTGGNPKTRREIHEKFEATYRALEDHAVRFRRPKYEFRGISEGHDRTYARKLRQMGPPKGYIGIIYSYNGTNGTNRKAFELVRNDVFLMRKARGFFKNMGDSVEIVSAPQPKTPPGGPPANAPKKPQTTQNVLSQYDVKGQGIGANPPPLDVKDVLPSLASGISAGIYGYNEPRDWNSDGEISELEKWQTAIYYGGPTALTTYGAKRNYTKNKERIAAEKEAKRLAEKNAPKQNYGASLSPQEKQILSPMEQAVLGLRREGKSSAEIVKLLDADIVNNSGIPNTQYYGHLGTPQRLKFTEKTLSTYENKIRSKLAQAGIPQTKTPPQR